MSPLPLTPRMSPTLLTLVCSLLALAGHSAGYNYGGALVMGAMQGEDLGGEDMGNIWNKDQVRSEYWMNNCWKLVLMPSTINMFPFQHVIK